MTTSGFRGILVPDQRGCFRVLCIGGSAGEVAKSSQADVQPPASYYGADTFPSVEDTIDGEAGDNAGSIISLSYIGAELERELISLAAGPEQQNCASYS